MSVRNGYGLDEDTGVSITSIELVKMPLTFTRHLERLAFSDSNLLMELAAEPSVCPLEMCGVMMTCCFCLLRLCQWLL